MLPQPDDTTCGPTCLHAVYRYWDERVTLDEVIASVPRLETGIAVVNFGFDKLRFLSAVPAGSRVRAHFVIGAATAKSDRELVIRYDVSVEIEGKPKPALAAEWLTIAFFG